MRKAVGYIGAALILGIFCAAFVAYFVTRVDPVSFVHRDGFGRLLSESPWWVSSFFDADLKWAGWNWFLADIVIFCCVMGIGIVLVYFGFRNKRAG